MEHDFKNYPELTNSQMRMFYFDSPHKQITDDFEAEVVKVTDGDTIRVMTDFRDFNFPVRFLNIDAPEITKGKNEFGGKESQQWLSKMVLGKQIKVLIDEDNRVEKWGRLLGEVLVDGLNVGELSLANGYSTKFEDRVDEQFKAIKETELY